MDDNSLWQPMTRTELGARIGVVTAAAALAAVVPNFGFVVSLLGAVTTMLLCFILPTAFYLQLHRAELSTVNKLLSLSIIFVGLVGMVVGLQNTLAAAL